MAKRRFNPNKVKLHRSYNRPELCQIFGIHKNTISNWERAGLVPVDNIRRPKLYAGIHVRAFVMHQNSLRRQPCPQGTIYCFKCHKPQAPKQDTLHFRVLRANCGDLIGACSVCGTNMFRRTRKSDLSQVMPNCLIQMQEGHP